MRRFALLFGLLFAAPSAHAVSLQIEVDGTPLPSALGWSDLGCSGDPNSTFNCSGGGATLGSITLDSWSMGFDADPVIGGNVAITNPTGSIQQYTLIFTLPVAPVLPSSITGGSISGTLTSLTADGVTVSTAGAGTSFYTARIDGAPWQTLYADPQSFFVAGFGSGTIPTVNFGAPIPSLPGPAVLTSIGIMLDFMLTPGDSASFTSNFVVLVPEPRLALLLVPALIALGLRRSR